MHTLAAADLRRPQHLLRTRAPWKAIAYLVCEALGGLVAIGSWFTVVLIPVWLLIWPRFEERLVPLAGHRRPTVSRGRWEMRWQDVVLVVLTAPMAVLVGFTALSLVIILGMLFAVPIYIATGHQATGWDADQVLPSVPTAIIAPLAGLLLGLLVLWAAASLAYGWGWLSVMLLRDDAKRLAAQVEALGEHAVHTGDVIALERRALERNLHDGAQMHLSAAAMRLGMLQLDAESLPEVEHRNKLLDGLDAAREQLDLAADSVRGATKGLVPPALRDGGLEAALGELIRSLPLDVELTADAPRLPADVEQSVYLMASEALTNVIRHAGADRARVVCRGEEITDHGGAGGEHAADAGGILLLEVSDDGRGGAETTGTGLVSMQARARMLGGSSELISPVGGPTVVRLRVPFESDGPLCEEAPRGLPESPSSPTERTL